MKKRAVIILMIVLTLFIIPNIKTQTVKTGLEAYYNNTAPILIQNIPDQYLAINLNKLNAFDLDDYFIDNETLTYTVNYLGMKTVSYTHLTLPTIYSV